MCAFQIEIRAHVIEGGAVELDDVGAATKMLAVAGFALGGGDILHAPMQPDFLGDVAGSFLVAIQAQCRLARAVGAVVAERTVFFVFRMCLRHFARHQQGLDRGSVCRRQEECRCRAKGHKTILVPSAPRHSGKPKSNQ